MAVVRLKDIAARAGVSLMTVSKALRNADDVAEATRARIKALAEQMGYVPDFSAQGLRKRATKLLGLIVPTSTNPAFAQIVLGLEERAYELGYDLLYAHTRNLLQREETLIQHMLARRVEGLFIYPVHRLQPEARIYQKLQARQLPVVLLGHPAPFCNSFPSVTTDDEAGSYEATRHLLQLHHRRIVFLAGPIAAPWARERLTGYQRALRDANIEPDDHLLFPGGSTVAGGAQAAERLLSEARDFTAIQAANDLVAIGCGGHLLDHGVRIPQDVSLVGFGDILMTEHFRVPLTTLHQPQPRIANAAMDIMSRLLRGLPGESRRLPATLIIRHSTGPWSAKSPA